MVNTSTVELFKGCKYDLQRNMSNFANLSAQNSYYNSLTKLTKPARFNKIGEPMLASGSISDILDYEYGRIQYDGIYYYFQVDSIEQGAQEQAIIHYTVDAWETMRYQKNLTLGAGYVQRSSERGRTYAYPTPYAPVNLTNELYHPLSDKYGSYDVNVLFFIYDDTNNSGTWGWYFCDKDFDLATGRWAVKCIEGIKGKSVPGLSDNIRILAGYISPFYDTYITTDYYTKCTDFIFVHTADDSAIQPGYPQVPVIWIDDFTAFRNSQFIKYKVNDMRGCEVWRASDGIQYTEIYGILDMSMSMVSWQMRANYNPNTGGGGTEIFYIPCEPLDIVNDAWDSYVNQRRAYDMQTRQVNSQQNLVSGLSSSVIGGGIAGATAGPVGAVIGAVGGAISSIAGYVLDTAVFGPEEQRITDEMYQRAQDAINLSGGGCSAVAWSFFREDLNEGRITCGIVKETWDTATQNLVNDDYDTFGYYTETATDNMENYVQDGPLKCDCVVKGCSLDFAMQVRSRLQNGVFFS